MFSSQAKNEIGECEACQIYEYMMKEYNLIHWQSRYRQVICGFFTLEKINFLIIIASYLKWFWNNNKYIGINIMYILNNDSNTGEVIEKFRNSFSIISI